MNRPLRGLSALALLIALVAPAEAQRKPVFQDGVILPNHLTKQTTTGLIKDVGSPAVGDAQGKGISPIGITDSLSPLGVCSYSHDPTVAGSYLCLGHDTAGVPTISVGAVGGAGAVTGPNLNVNGAIYALPGSGAGNVSGPNPTVVNNLTFWNSATGTLLKDTSNILTVAQDTQTAGAKFEIQKKTSPLNYANTRAAFVVQQRDSQSGIINELPPGVVFDLSSTGNGVVNSGTHLSQTIWMGTTAVMTKSGDGSGHSITTIGNLDAVGTGGYNELCAVCGTTYNRASTNGTVAGLEFQVGDSADFGVTTPGPTQISVLNARVQKWNADRSRSSQAILFSSEGSVAPDAIMATLTGYATFVAGMDFSKATFTGGAAAILPNNTSLSWMNSSAQVVSGAFLDGGNLLQLGYGISGGATPLNVQANNTLFLSHATQPGVKFLNTGATANNRYWFADVLNNQFRSYVANDLNNTFAYWVKVDRVGVTVPKITLGDIGTDIQLATGAALSTGATIGFPYIPAMAGAPTGAPSNYAPGAIPIVIDTTNHKICWNETGAGGGWKCALGT